MDISYRTVRSGRKTLALQVTPSGEVVVRAPFHTADAQIIRFVTANHAWIVQKLAESAIPRPIHRPLSEEELASLIAQAQATIPGRVAHFSAIMGLQPSGVRISKTTGRFGSCSKHDKLAFTCRLMLYPPEAIDYVVVHELAHIAHKNHGPEFWRTVARVLPDYKNRNKLLRA